MRKFTYKFNKPVAEVLVKIKDDIDKKEFIGNINGNNIELNRICEGYRSATTYKLTANLQNNSDGGCVLTGCFMYNPVEIITILILSVIMFAFSSFLAVVYSGDIGKYLLVFSCIISVAYVVMTFFKRKDVVAQTKKLFDEINAG
ncbi:MAG: hypothetical protein U0M12_01825 [Acutalibacteraceae bacterium]|nr:hypothetical protein [Acutalibacteraceae bacterium]